MSDHTPVFIKGNKEESIISNKEVLDPEIYMTPEEIEDMEYWFFNK